MELQVLHLVDILQVEEEGEEIQVEQVEQVVVDQEGLVFLVIQELLIQVVEVVAIYKMVVVE